MRRELFEHCVEKFEKAGLEVRRTERRGKPVLVVRAAPKDDLALAMLSLMWHLDRDHCLVRREMEPRNAWVDRTYVVWHPVSWFTRFAVDFEQKLWILLMGIAMAFVAAVAVGAIAAVRVDGNVGVLQLLGSVAVLLLVLGALRRKFGEEPGLGLDALWLRLSVGLVVGIAWALAVSPPSTVQILGAFWVFAFTNILWVMTIGYLRWRFEETLDELGGRLSWREAHEVLDRATGTETG